MIASLEGVVASVAADSLVIEVGGIGYRVFAAPTLLADATAGARLKVHTHHLVREDLQALYGFRSADELGFFGLLLTVTGVGPKVALAILGSRPVAELQLAILADDQAILTATSGVGKRLAARIVLELREKVETAGLAAGGAAAAGSPPGSIAGGDVVAALEALGYTPSEARAAARAGTTSSDAGTTLEDRVKASLRALSGGAG